MNSSPTDITVPGYVAKVLRTLNENGYEAYAVGGCVRDALLGRTPDDWDVTTSAKPEETKSCFSGYHVIETGIKHGTVTVRIEHESVEITTYRTDGEYADHRHPDTVTFSGKLTDDLSRRDFTVNAMCLASDGTVLDPFGGRDDLKNAVIRCVGDPEKRFDEDALRILRAIRFAAVLGFSADAPTAAAIRKMKGLLHGISAERVFVELKKTLTRLKAPEILTEFRDVFTELFPELNDADENAYARAAGLVPAADDTAGALALFFSPLSPEQAGNILTRLKSDKKTRNDVLFLLSHKNTGLTDRENLFRLTGESGIENMKGLGRYRNILDEHFDDSVLNETVAAVLRGAPVKPAQLALRGQDIASLGVSGADIGYISSKLLTAVWNGEADNTKESLLSYVNSVLLK